LIVIAGALAMAAIAAVPVTLADGARSSCAPVTVKVSEHMTYVVNRYVQDAMRFSPGTVTVRSGCALTFAFASRAQDEPHSLSIVRRVDLPRTAAQMESCRICGQIAAKHVEHPGQPPGATNPVVHWIVNVGEQGLDAPGDSIVIFEGKGAPPSRRRVTVPVSAPAGKVLYFMCGLHPWMQGKIVVT
jgi:plastocyanin